MKALGPTCLSTSDVVLDMCAVGIITIGGLPALPHVVKISLKGMRAVHVHAAVGTKVPGAYDRWPQRMNSNKRHIMGGPSLGI